MANVSGEEEAAGHQVRRTTAGNDLSCDFQLLRLSTNSQLLDVRLLSNRQGSFPAILVRSGCTACLGSSPAGWRTTHSPVPTMTPARPSTIRSRRHAMSWSGSREPSPSTTCISYAARCLVRSCLLEAQAPATIVRRQDYLGVWNEAPYDAGYVKLLRKALDASGFTDTLIVGHDAGLELLTPSPSLFVCLVLTGSVWSNQALTSALPCLPTQS